MNRSGIIHVFALGVALALSACVSQSVGPGGVEQSAGGPSQSVTPAGVKQSSGSPPPGHCLNAGCKWDNGSVTAGTNCRATCSGNEYAISCPASQRAVCQCSHPPYASCGAVKP